MAPPPTSIDETFAIGSLLDGRYRIEAVLGTGGMGRVYRAEHTKIGKPVAIKVLHADLHRNREASQRFQREAIASGRLDHPNIVGVSDFGVLDGGTCYLVMEVLEGESLGDRLAREKRIHWVEAIDILRGVLHGLRHAHERGVVHRDIKPDNVFLARKDGDPVIKILDFGIAKLYAGSSDDPASTRAGLTVGTPAYLSPEQACGGEITPKSDLYSASIVLYEMLAGRAPFEDKDPLAMLGAHVSRRPPMFAVIAPGVDIPPQLEEIIQHGLRKSPNERIGTAADYIALIDAFSPPLYPMPRAATPLELEAAAARIKIPPSLIAATRDPLPPRIDAMQAAWEAARGKSVIGAPVLGKADAASTAGTAGSASTAPTAPSSSRTAPAPGAAAQASGAAGAAAQASPGAAAASSSDPGASSAHAFSAAAALAAASSSPGVSPAQATRSNGGVPAAAGARSAPAVSFDMAQLPPAIRAVSLGDVGEPIPLTWIVRSGVVIGLVIVAAIVLAIATRCGGSEPSPRPGARATAVAPTTSGSGSGSGSASDRAPPPAPTRSAPAAGSGSARAAEREAQYNQAIDELENAKTCNARKAAIGKLVELADPRAVARLRRATSRQGPGDKGNACLKVDADRAIEALSALK